MLGDQAGQPAASPRITVSRAFTNRCVLAESEGTLSSKQAAMLKWWNTELLVKVVDRCVQLHSGYGYMTEYHPAILGPRMWGLRV
jgi:alkylation response protein AidB-like acyl-CoA dehydrogenase